MEGEEKVIIRQERGRHERERSEVGGREEVDEVGGRN